MKKQVPQVPLIINGTFSDTSILNPGVNFSDTLRGLLPKPRDWNRWAEIGASTVGHENLCGSLWQYAWVMLSQYDTQKKIEFEVTSKHIRHKGLISNIYIYICLWCLKEVQLTTRTSFGTLFLVAEHPHKKWDHWTLRHGWTCSQIHLVRPVWVMIIPWYVHQKIPWIFPGDLDVSRHNSHDIPSEVTKSPLPSSNFSRRPCQIGWGGNKFPLEIGYFQGPCYIIYWMEKTMDHGAMPLLHLLKQTQHLAKTRKTGPELPVDCKDPLWVGSQKTTAVDS